MFDLALHAMTVVEFLNRASHVKNWDTFVYFYMNLPGLLQIVLGLAFFGIGSLVYIFIAALFSDKYTPGA